MINIKEYKAKNICMGVLVHARTQSLSFLFNLQIIIIVKKLVLYQYYYSGKFLLHAYLFDVYLFYQSKVIK